MDPNTEIDLLADGELDPDRRRALLARLESSPAGWRRLALAFVEAQVVRESVRALAPAASGVATQAALPPAKPAPRPGRGHAWWALAASALLSFGLGVATRGLPGGAGGGPAVVPPAEVVVATSPEAGGVGGAEDGADDASLEFWVDGGAGGRQSLRTHLVDAQAFDLERGTRFRSALPGDLRERLRSYGYDVRSRQRYAPLYLGDGQPVVVPVEDVEILPVSHRLL